MPSRRQRRSQPDRLADHRRQRRRGSSISDCSPSSTAWSASPWPSGLAAGSHRNAPGVLLAGLSAAVLALALTDARIAVVAATAGGLVGILVTIAAPASARSVVVASRELRALSIAGLLAILATAWIGRPLGELGAVPEVFGFAYVGFAAAVAIGSGRSHSTSGRPPGRRRAGGDAADADGLGPGRVRRRRSRGPTSPSRRCCCRSPLSESGSLPSGRRAQCSACSLRGSRTTWNTSSATPSSPTRESRSSGSPRSIRRRGSRPDVDPRLRHRPERICRLGRRGPPSLPDAPHLRAERLGDSRAVAGLTLGVVGGGDRVAGPRGVGGAGESRRPDDCRADRVRRHPVRCRPDRDLWPAAVRRAVAAVGRGPRRRRRAPDLAGGRGAAGGRQAPAVPSGRSSAAVTPSEASSTCSGACRRRSVQAGRCSPASSRSRSRGWGLQSQPAALVSLRPLVPCRVSRRGRVSRRRGAARGRPVGRTAAGRGVHRRDGAATFRVRVALGRTLVQPLPSG